MKPNADTHFDPDLKHPFAPSTGWGIAYVRPWFLVRCATRRAMRSAASRLNGRYFGPDRNVIPVMSAGFERRFDAWMIRVRSYADQDVEHAVHQLHAMLS